LRRRLGWLGIAALSALAASALAIAAHGLTTKAVSATFTAAPAAANKISTCKGTDGDYTRIEGQYTGTSTSTDARLAGPITIRGESLVNKTTGLGWMKGTLRIDTAGHEDTKGNFTAVISGGQLSGFLSGNVHRDEARLLGGLSAAFGATGITSGSIGSTAATPALVTAGGCDHEKGHDKGKGHENH
jgi:hypothetical protein